MAIYNGKERLFKIDPVARKIAIRSIVSDLVQKTDIVDVIGRDTVLKKTGKEYRGLCPFHAEKTPSFFVNPELGVYYCFGCGVKGGVIDYVMNHDGKSFGETLESLGAPQDAMDELFPLRSVQYNASNNNEIRAVWNEEKKAKRLSVLELEKAEEIRKNADPMYQKRIADAKKILNITSEYAAHCLRACDQEHPVKKYLAGRGYGLEREFLIDKFSLGYFPRSSENLLRSKTGSLPLSSDVKDRSPLWVWLRNQTIDPDIAGWDDARLFTALHGSGSIAVRKNKAHASKDFFDIEDDFLNKEEKVIPNFFELFSGRLTFPIGDNGAVVAFSGRSLETDPVRKYINSPKTDIYQKSKVLYNLDKLNNAGGDASLPVLIVEGFFDVISLYGAGWTRAVATCGTALSTEALKKLVDAVSVNGISPAILLCMDGDKAGIKAAERIYENLMEEYHNDCPYPVGVLTMPTLVDIKKNIQEDRCIDPDDMVKNYIAKDHNGDDFITWWENWLKDENHVSLWMSRSIGYNYATNAKTKQNVSKHLPCGRQPSLVDKVWYWLRTKDKDSNLSSKLVNWLSDLSSDSYTIMREESGWSDADKELWVMVEKLAKNEPDVEISAYDYRVEMVENWLQGILSNLLDVDSKTTDVAHAKQKGYFDIGTAKEVSTIASSGLTEQSEPDKSLAVQHELDFVLDRIKKLSTRCLIARSMKAVHATGSVGCLSEEEKIPLTIRMNDAKDDVIQKNSDSYP